MAENYCGKTCEGCGMKEKLSCSGCKAGPGRMYGGECPVAKCCQERGHNTCATCNQNNWCAKQKNAEGMAETRFQKQEQERAKREKLEKQVPLLAKCLTLIFWLSIVSLLPGVISNDLTKNFPVLHATGQIINAILSIAIIAVYFVMRKVNHRYQKVALIMAVTTVINFLIYCFGVDETAGWIRLVQIVEAVLGLICRHHMYTAHSEVLVSVDYALSEKWMGLWQWYIRITVAMIASIVAILILPIIGMLVFIAVGIGFIVISIVEIVYFCRMMVAFRTYAKNLAA